MAVVYFVFESLLFMMKSYPVEKSTEYAVLAEKLFFASSESDFFSRFVIELKTTNSTMFVRFARRGILSLQLHGRLTK